MLSYFDGLAFGAADRVVRCNAWIDQAFDCYAMNYAYSGRIRWHGVDGRAIWLEAPVLYWSWPGPRFTYGAEVGSGETWDQSYVTYRGARAAAMARRGLAPHQQAPFVAVSDSGRARNLFDALLACLHQAIPAVDEAVYLLEGLYLLAHAPPPAAMDPIAAAIHRLANDIRATPHLSWNAEDEADHIGVSMVHLRRLFAKQIGSPLHRFVVLARMQTAAGLLRRTDLKIKVVAERSGYPDVYHFTKAFSAEHGRPPAAYRQQARRLGSGA